MCSVCDLYVVCMPYMSTYVLYVLISDCIDLISCIEFDTDIFHSLLSFKQYKSKANQLVTSCVRSPNDIGLRY